MYTVYGITIKTNGASENNSQTNGQLKNTSNYASFWPGCFHARIGITLVSALHPLTWAHIYTVSWPIAHVIFLLYIAVVIPIRIAIDHLLRDLTNTHTIQFLFMCLCFLSSTYLVC